MQKAVSLAPDDWSLVQQLGEYYLVQGKWAEAGEQYRRASELAPDNPRAHNNLGLSYRGLDKLDESAAAFQRAIDLEPTFLRVRNLGMVLAEAGKYPEAVRMLQRSIDIQPTQYRAWGLLAGVYLNQHADAKTVRDTYLKAIELSADLRKRTPRDSYLLADVGSYYAALGNEAQGVPLLVQAAALSPDAPEVLYQVAIGTKRSTIVTRRCASLQRPGRLAMLRGRLRAILNWQRFVPTRVHRGPRRRPLASASEGDEPVLTQSAPASFEIAFPHPAMAALICAGDNPNVDRSPAPPPRKKKKAAKKKPTTKRPAKKR